MIGDIVITTASTHIRNIDSAGAQTIRRKIQGAVSEACEKARAQGARPISAVDDLSVHRLGPWIGTFAACLARSAKREGISICGGEMAQMAGTYRRGCISVFIAVAALKEDNDVR